MPLGVPGVPAVAVWVVSSVFVNVTVSPTRNVAGLGMNWNNLTSTEPGAAGAGAALVGVGAVVVVVVGAAVPAAGAAAEPSLSLLLPQAARVRPSPRTVARTAALGLRAGRRFVGGTCGLRGEHDPGRTKCAAALGAMLTAAIVERVPDGTSGPPGTGRAAGPGARRQRRRGRGTATSVAAVLVLARSAHLALVAHLLDGMPDEACGLLAGPPAGDGRPAGDAEPAQAVRFYPTANAAASSRVYTVEPRDHLRADRDAEDHGLEILGVVHSHTHTEPYPSPTDVGQAPDPSWHYVIVSFRTGVPSLRSYRIVDGAVTEEPVTLVDG